MRYFKINHSSQGFTLIELMIVITLLAIMTIMAAPAMMELIARQRVAAAAQSIASAVNFARAEAMRSNAPVYAVPAKIKVDGTLNGAVTDKTWDAEDNQGNLSVNGILIFQDKNRDGQYSANEDLRVYKFNDTVKVKIEGRSLANHNTKKTGFEKGALTFTPIGLMRMNQEADVLSNHTIGSIARIVVQHRNSAKHCRAIKVASAGRAEICGDFETREANKSGVDSHSFCRCRN